MELNGVANIKMLTDQIEELVKSNKSQFGEIGGLAHEIKQQLNTLERYMLAQEDYRRSVSFEKTYTKNEPGMWNHEYIRVFFEKPDPMWHEVRENPEKYPTLKERMSGIDTRKQG